MEIKKVVEALEKSREFKEWKKNHKNSYFADAFVIIDGDSRTDWQLGYYDEETDKITVFLMSKPIVVKPAEEVFKKGGKVKEVDIKNLKNDIKDALAVCDSFCRREYSSETALKKIAVLQHLDIGQVWNITQITNNYNTLNIKIDAETGRVLRHKLSSMFDFVKE